jgi:hypothetical protein
MASKRVDQYLAATPADADQAIAIDASDTTDSSAGTVKRFVLSDLFTYVLNKILARVNTWTATQTFSAVVAGNDSPDAPGDISVSVARSITATPTGNAASAGNFEVHSAVVSGNSGYYLLGLGGVVDIEAGTTIAPDGAYGLNFAAKHNGPDDIDYLNGAYINTFEGGAGGVTDVNVIELASLGFGGAGQAVTKRMIKINTPLSIGRPKPTHTIGLAIDDFASTGATDSYAIKTGTGAVYLGDTLTVIGNVTAPNLLTTVAAAAAYQPLDSDLTAIAALSTTVFGRALLALADASALRTVAALGTAATADTGTGAANVPTITQADARYQPLDSDLTAIAALSTTAFGRSLLASADAAALRTLAALGTIATQDANNVSISGGAITGITDLAVADGGTGASTAANARTNLGLVIGTDVEAHDADLTAIAAISTTGVLQRTGSNTWAAAALIASDIPSLDAAKITSGTLAAARIVASQALTDQATITWDTSAGAFATVTLAGSRTVAAPTNLTAGASYGIKVTQDGTGGRALTWNAVFKWSGGTPVLSTAASAIDVLTFISDGTNLYGSILKGFA